MFIYIHGFMLVLIEVFCCKIFFEAFAENKMERNILFSYTWLLGMVIYDYLLALVLYHQFALKQILIISGIIFFMRRYFYLHIRKAVLLSLLFQGLLLSVDYLSLWLNVTLFHSIAEINQTYYIGGNLLAVLTKVFLFMAVLVIRNKVDGKYSTVLKDAEWLRFLIFPVFTVFIIVSLLAVSGNIENQKQGDVFLAIAICLAGMNIFVFYLINDILQREAKLWESELLKQQAQHQIRLFRFIFKNYEKQRKKTHEYKNQMMCIESLLALKRYDELRKYVEKINGSLSSEPDYVRTNHAMVDAVLNSKYREMQEKNIMFVFKSGELSGLPVEDNDIVVILSNLLNNAIEACEKCRGEKVIKMKFVKEKDNMILSVRNTYNGHMQTENGEIITSKNYETDLHGVGIKNIIETIAKYHGRYAIQYTDREFFFSILIPILEQDRFS